MKNGTATAPALMTAALLLMVACKSDPMDGPDTAMAGLGSDEEPPPAPCPEDLPPFTQDMESRESESGWTAVVRKATPAPPQKYENDWQVEVLDGEGNPLEDAEIVFVQPFMPAHGHDGGFVPEVTALEEPSQFEVDRINLWMGGAWEVRLDVASGDDQNRLIFDVCIEN